MEPRNAVILFIVLLIGDYGSCAMTEAQLQSGLKVLRKKCQPKVKVTDEQIENLGKGIWDDQTATKCYTYCLLNSYRLVDKNGKFDVEYAAKNIGQMPKPRQAPILASLEKCKGTDLQYEDKCDATYFLLKCIYFDNPANYIGN